MRPLEAQAHDGRSEGDRTARWSGSVLRRPIAALFFVAACAAVNAQEIRLSPPSLLEDKRTDTLLSRALQAEADKDWAQVVQLYQEAIDKYPEAVLTTSSATYEGVIHFCLSRLRSLPVEATSAYRTRFDPRIHLLFSVACRNRDEEALERILEEYPLSSYASQSASLLAALAFEKGDENRLEHVIQRIAELPDGFTTGRPLAELALLAQRSGAAQTLEDLENRIREQYPRLTFRKGETSESLLPYVRELKKSSERSMKTASGPGLPWEWATWSAYGGSASRSAVSGLEKFYPFFRPPPAPAEEAGAAPLPPRTWSWHIGRSAKHRSQGDLFLHHQLGEDEDDTFLPYFPVLQHGLLYVATDITVYAFDLLTRKPRLLWKREMPIPTSRILFDNRAVHTATLADGRLYVPLVTTMGEAVRRLNWLDVTYPIPHRALFCFDAMTGKDLWKVGGQRDAEEFLKKASFTMAPICDAGRCYAGATFWKMKTDPIDHYVVALDAESGELVWKRQLSAGFLETNLFDNSARESFGSAVTLRGDTLYYATNMGLVAALDKHSGRIRWLRRYLQYQIPPTREIQPIQLPLRWLNNPIIATERGVFAAPMDSPYLLALDPETGKDLYPFLSQASDKAVPDPQQYLLGEAEGILVSQGPEGLTGFDLARGGRRRWIFTPEQGIPIGRGMLTGEDVLFSTEQGLYRLDARTGSLESLTPWPAGDSRRADGGNLFCFQGLQIVASSTELDMYLDTENLARFLERERERHPRDPHLLLRMATAAEDAGELEKARQYCFDAYERVAPRLRQGFGGQAGAEAPVSPLAGSFLWRTGGLGRLEKACEESLFRLTVRLAERESRRGGFSRATALLEEALQWAKDPQRWVTAKMETGNCLRLAGDNSRALAVYHEILREHPDTPHKGKPAAQAAEKAIARILRHGGTTLYAPFEREARKLLEESLARRDPEGLQQVARWFPKSQAAQEALVGLADEEIRQNRLAEATRTLTEFRTRFTDSVLLPRALVLLGDLYERRKMSSNARQTWKELLERFPDALVGGLSPREEPAADLARRRLSALGPPSRMAPSLPDRYDWPLVLRWSFQWQAPAAIRSVALSGKLSAPLENRIFFSGNAELIALHSASGRKLWSVPLEGELVGLYGSEDLQAVVAVSTRAAKGIAAEKGGIVWEAELGSNAVQAAAATQGLVVLRLREASGRGDTTLLGLDGSSGQPRWKKLFAAKATEGSLLATEEFLIVLEDPDRLAVREGATGELRSSISLGHPPQLLQPLGEQKLLAVLDSNHVAAYDLVSGALSWTAALPAVRNLVANNGSMVAYLAFERASQGTLHLVLVEAETGQVVRKVALGELGLPKSLWMDEERVYFLHKSRQTEDQVVLRAYGLPRMEPLWTFQQSRKGVNLFSPADLPKEILLNLAEYDPEQGGWWPMIVAVDKVTGRSNGHVSFEDESQEGKAVPGGAIPELCATPQGIAIVQGKQVSFVGVDLSQTKESK